LLLGNPFPESYSLVEKMSAYVDAATRYHNAPVESALREYAEKDSKFTSELYELLSNADSSSTPIQLIRENLRIKDEEILNLEKKLSTEELAHERTKHQMNLKKCADDVQKIKELETSLSQEKSLIADLTKGLEEGLREVTSDLDASFMPHITPDTSARGLLYSFRTAVNRMKMKFQWAQIDETVNQQRQKSIKIETMKESIEAFYALLSKHASFHMTEHEATYFKMYKDSVLKNIEENGIVDVNLETYKGIL
ncbi:MAG: hypothetical protein AAGM67_15500, partial [Bacteroidota bacterium]